MPRDKKEIVWFGMKLSPEEKRKIEFLAKEQGISKKEVIMKLVNEEVAEYRVDASPGSTLSRIQNGSAIYDGPEDLSYNSKYLQGFGKNRNS